MFFKKFNGQIFGVEYTKKEKEFLDREINEVKKELVKTTELDIESCILWYFHEKLGYGHDRLMRVYNEFHSYIKALSDHYEMDEDDGPFVARLKLKDMGIDLEKLREDENIDSVSKHSS